MKQKLFDELSHRIGALLPEGTESIRADIETSIHLFVQETFNKLNLVSREEFDLQSALLQRSREKLDRLEKQLETLTRNTENTPENNKPENNPPD